MAVPLLSCALLPACAAVAPPPPPPFAGGPPGVPIEILTQAPAPETPKQETRAPDAEPPEPRATIVVEAPFRLDRRVVPPTRPAFLAELADRTRWNKGDMGKPRAVPPPVPGHPSPKVILDVVHAKGPLPSADAQRVLRARFWIKAVECFSLGAYKNQSLRGTATLAVKVASSGKVDAASVRDTSFTDAEVNTCLADRMRGMKLPSARAGSRLAVELQLGHGDEPVAPPAALIVPGDGELLPEAIRGVIDAATPSFEACYRAAFAYAPELWGRLGIRFHVTEKGRTDEAFEVESTFPDERVTLCVLGVARKLTFPKPAGGDLRFVVPLRFSSDRSSGVP